MTANFTGLPMPCEVNKYTAVIVEFVCVYVYTCSQFLLLFEDTTRNLYERKLREAMSKGIRAKPTSDKTFYREEGNCHLYSFIAVNTKALLYKIHVQCTHRYTLKW